MATSRSKPTMRDVATRAGVSQSTVSLVLNAVENTRIGADTRTRVLEASRALGYRSPDAAPIAMTRTVGLVLDALSPDGIGAPMIDALREACAGHGAQLLVSVTGGTDAEGDAALDSLLAARPFGLILASATPRVVEVPARLTGVPTVLMNACAPTPARPGVLPDIAEGARIGLRHILDLGHRSIAFLDLAGQDPFTTRRRAVLDEVMDAAGLPLDPALIRPLDGARTGAFDATVELLRARPDITAIVCASDRLAVGALDAAAHLGRRPGQDIAILGHGDSPAAAETHPPLTTVRIPLDRIARTAVETLVSGRTDPEVTTIAGTLVVRDSTMPARTAPASPPGPEPRAGDSLGAISHHMDALGHRSVREVVADKLSGLIASGVLAVGDELPSERDLAQAWQVSRESVRGGLRILATRGVLAVAQGARTRVVSDFLRDTDGAGVSSARLNAFDIHHINGARQLVELEVVGRAAERIGADTLAFLDASLAAQRRSLSKPVEFLICDREFHFAIYEAAGNEVLTDLVKDLYGYMMPNRVRVMGGPDAIATSIADHEAIVDALRQRDRDATIRCFERHIERIYRSTLRSLGG